MTHLNDEQFEDVLHGKIPEPAHLAECEMCRNLLAEKRALQSRLQMAFGSVRASDQLAGRIHEQIANASKPAAPLTAAPALSFVRAHRWFIPLTAVAALLLVSIPLILFFASPQPATAAQQELYRIHQHGLSPETELFAQSDPEALARHLKNELGFKPAFPRLGAGMSLRGCCVVHFKDKPVGSYVVDTPRGVMSIIVTSEPPESLGMKDRLRRGDHVYLGGSFANCNMVTVELGGYTYCAVGEVSRDYLTDLLEQLVW